MRSAVLSAVQRRIAGAILALEKRSEPAFVPELVRRLGYAAESSLTATLRRMERDGLVILRGGGAKGRARVALLTARARFALGAGGLPLLGSIPAGPLEEALTESEIVEPAGLLPSREGDFLLRVRGDSMTGDGILPGDRVLLRPHVRAEQGEIAAVLVGDAQEATLKRVFLLPRTCEVLLRAANPKYPDRRVPAGEVRIAGVYRGLIRHAGRTR